MARAIVRPVVVTCHNNNCLQTVWKIPEARQRLSRGIHQQDDVCQKTLLLVCLWNCNVAQIDPIQLGIEACCTKEQVVWANWGQLAVPLLAGPRWIALPRVNDGTGQIVTKGGRL